MVPAAARTYLTSLGLYYAGNDAAATATTTLVCAATLLRGIYYAARHAYRRGNTPLTWQTAYHGLQPRSFGCRLPGLRVLRFGLVDFNGFTLPPPPHTHLRFQVLLYGYYTVAYLPTAAFDYDAFPTPPQHTPARVATLTAHPPLPVLPLRRAARTLGPRGFYRAEQLPTCARVTLPFYRCPFPPTVTHLLPTDLAGFPTHLRFYHGYFHWFSCICLRWFTCTATPT